MKTCMGTTRQVFLIGKIAIKIPRICSWRTFLYGLLSNIREHETWKSLHSNLLAKVHYADIFGLLLIMERADSICSKYDNTLPIFFFNCRRLGIARDEMYFNVGKFKGQKKLIDYGG